MNLYFCVPTYKEPDSVKGFLNSISSIDIEGFVITAVIANSGFYDETSDLINSFPVSKNNIIELEGKSEEFWSATVNRCFDKVVSISNSADDIVVVCNIDINFSQDTINELLKVYLTNTKSCVGSLGYYNNKIISSAVVCSSSFYGFNKHPFAGCDYDFIANESSTKCDFLPGRFMMFSIAYLNNGLRVDSESFPHYHADYVLSHDLKALGADLILAPKSRFYSDRENTGNSPFAGNNNFIDRARNTFSLRSSSNPIFKIKFIFRVTKYRYIVPALLIALVKTSLEIILGQGIKKIFGLKERGF